METSARFQTLQPSSNTSPRYRPEIDGLRALAVIAVIIYHFNKEVLPGGYLGVDIFFVISGFVITASLAKRQSHSPREFLLGFYERRIKRLMPALILCVVITSALLCLVDPTPGLRLGIAWRSLLGFSNIALYNLSTDYFSASTEINPFTHTWSLGVEQQFYLLFPFLLLWTGFVPVAEEGAAFLFKLISALSIASLIGFFYFQSANQPAAFFLLPSRFWELGAGCLLFLASLPSLGGLAGWRHRIHRLPGLAPLIGMLILMLLPLPLNGAASAGIVLLTILLLANQRERGPCQALLGHPRVVMIGLISYSLYLWHWSVLVLSRWTVGVHWWTIPFQLGLIVLLAWMSYRWIEQPLRSHRWSALRWRSIAYGIAASLLGAAAILGLSRGTNSLLFLGERKQRTNPTAATEASCQQGGNYTILFAGDSHANHYRQSEGYGCGSHAARILVSSTAGMPYPLVSYTNSTTGHDQDANLSRQIAMDDRWRSIPPPAGSAGVVVIALRANLYFNHDPSVPPLFRNTNNRSVDTHQPISADLALTEWIADLEELVRRHPATEFVLFLPTPEFQQAYPIETCTPQWFRPGRSQTCLRGTERASLNRFNQAFLDRLREPAARHPNLHIFDAFSALCPPSQPHCPRMIDGEPLYVDQDHLSLLGSNRVIDQLVVFLQQQGLWKP